MLKLPIIYIQKALNTLNNENHQLIDVVNNEGNILGLCILKNNNHLNLFHIHLLDIISFLFLGWFSIEGRKPISIGSFDGFNFGVEIEDEGKFLWGFSFEYYNWDNFIANGISGTEELSRLNINTYCDYINKVFEYHRLKYHYYSILYRSGIKQVYLDTYNPNLSIDELNTLKLLHEEIIDKIKTLQNEYPIKLMRNI